MRPRALVLLLVLSSTLPFAPASGAQRCTPRLVVLGAMPVEVDDLLARTHPRKPVVADGRRFVAGRLQGHDVLVAMTGIGLVNAEQTARAALAANPCGVTGFVFSGVSGGAARIADVTVASRWTLDGTTWFDTDEAMLAAARSAAPGVPLSREAAVGDPACLGADLSEGLVLFEHQPEVFVGGDGFSSDPFDGRRLPCLPGGGDVFGCAPCGSSGDPVADVTGLATDGPGFVDPDFFADYDRWSRQSLGGYAAVDMETAAAARVAAERGVPFIAFRALSDGDGDPLGLPGFPFQFFAYRDVAATNAARMTLAFLEEYA